MIISVELKNFRNFAYARAELDERVNIVFGPNGYGKSNFLEALYVCGFGRSFRGSGQQIVKFDADFARVVAKNPQHETLEAVFLPNGVKNFILNSKRLPRLRDLLGKFPTIYVGPDEVNIVAGSPSKRRNFLDFTISQYDPVYVSELGAYVKSVAQRNSALRGVAEGEIAGGMVLIETIDEQVAHHGAQVLATRSRFLRMISPLATEIFAAISGIERQLDIEYLSTAAENLDDPELERVYFERLCARRKSDLKTFQTAIGPHRDDIEIYLGNLPAKKFASWGQVRMISLALHLAAARILEEKIGRTPTLLFDDALAELDPQRAHSVLEIAPQFGQIVVATPHPEHLIEDAKVFRLAEAGKIVEGK